MKNWINRLFFYSSRQLMRRWRSYLSIFLTSVVLLTLVMTFLEMADSFFMRQTETNRNGTHHAVIMGMLYDYSDEIMTDDRIESAYSIPYTSMMASSDDTSVPARMTVYTEEAAERLGVRFLWGEPPADGEIAVSEELFNSYGYLTAGVMNDLYFKAGKMTYYPLKLTGIFTTSDKNAGYSFVNKKTLGRIDSETGAIERFDIYLRCKYNSDRNIAKVLNSIMRRLKIPDTDFQSRKSARNDLVIWSSLLSVYTDYINTEYLYELKNSQAAPVILVSMPVIIAAALMLASFVSNWMISNSAEYGILGAIGANRRQLCAISAGQVLLLSMVAAVPVIIGSAGLASAYISVFNSISENDVDYVYKIPLWNIIKASMWFSVLSCIFTYFGISALTKEAPFVLISGSYRAKLPFVKKTSGLLSRVKDKISAVSFITAMRLIKSEIVGAVITSLICIVCGAFIVILIVFKTNTITRLTEYDKHDSDISISVKNNLSYGRIAHITSDTIELTKSINGIAWCGGYSYINESSYSYNSNKLSDSSVQEIKLPYIDYGNQNIEKTSAMVADNSILDLLCGSIITGDISELTDGKVIVVSGSEMYHSKSFVAGEKLEIIDSAKLNLNSGNMTYGNVREFEISAVAARNTEFSDIRINKLTEPILIFTPSDAARLGYIGEDEYDGMLAYFEDSLSDEEKNETVEMIYKDPGFMRYNVECFSVMTNAEKRTDAVNTLFLAIFFGMLYFSFCVMTYTNSLLKITKSRSDIAVMRQTGATDKKILKTLRVQTYPISALSLVITIVLFGILIYAYSTYALGELYKQADLYPVTYTVEYFAECKEKILSIVTFMAVLGAASLPMQLISAGVRILGTIPTAKRILGESIVDGLRKDTD